MNDTASTPTPRGPSATTHGLVAGSALAAVALIVGVWFVQGGSLTPMQAKPAQTATATQARMPGQVATFAPRAATPASPAPVAAAGQPAQAPAAVPHPNPWADPRMYPQWAAMNGAYGPLNYMQAPQAMFISAMRAWHAQVQMPATAATTTPVPPRG